QESFERAAVGAGLVGWEDCPCQQEALALHARLAGIDPAAVAVVTTQRRPGRKELAAMARGLFARLALQGVSVTAPSYSMAQGVEVGLPRRLDLSPLNAQESAFACPARVANREAERRVQAILYTAFPGTTDRSNSQTDYFDYCWSIN